MRPLSAGRTDHRHFSSTASKGNEGNYIKFTTGSSEERPCAGVAAVAEMEKGICRELRLAVGAVSARPVRITAGEELADGQSADAELDWTHSGGSGAAVDPIEDVRGPAEYKRHLVGVLVRRALTTVTETRERTS